MFDCVALGNTSTRNGNGKLSYSAEKEVISGGKKSQRG